jgi:hypothetical protein
MERLGLLGERDGLLDDPARRTVSEPLRRAVEALHLREKAQALDPDDADRHGRSRPRDPAALGSPPGCRFEFAVIGGVAAIAHGPYTLFAIST